MDDADAVRQFITDVASGMRYHVKWRHLEKNDISHAASGSDMKNFYGDTWVFFYGISKGKNLIYESSEISTVPSDAHLREVDSVGDEAWQEEYEEFGHGVYGRGLEIGKRLAVWSGPDRFEFVEPDENGEETQFTFTE